MREGSNRRLVLYACIFLVCAALLLTFLSGDKAFSSTDDTEVELIYFYPRFRCLSCEQVDSYASEAAATYENNGMEGVPYTRLGIDDSANRDKVEEYGVVGSSLSLIPRRDGEEDFRELQKVWFLW